MLKIYVVQRLRKTYHLACFSSIPMVIFLYRDKLNEFNSSPFSKDPIE